MTQLEIVHLRLTGPHLPGLVQLIRRSVADQAGVMALRVYRNRAIPTDLSVHLELAAHETDPQVTELGLRLVAALKMYGMVERSVWLEEPSSG